MRKKKREPLTAAQFFARGIAGGSMSDAMRGTGISYPTIHAHAKHGATINTETAKALQAWSLTVSEAGAAYISAAKTVGFSEPRS